MREGYSSLFTHSFCLSVCQQHVSKLAAIQVSMIVSNCTNLQSPLKCQNFHYGLFSRKTIFWVESEGHNSGGSILLLFPGASNEGTETSYLTKPTFGGSGAGVLVRPRQQPRERQHSRPETITGRYQWNFVCALYRVCLCLLL